ncbi:choice-of-anchor E domain-containing protein [Ectothiorhodospiraceae bacterium WFHF3C12]|nr:choice-of-anchor E domain-containing protein [Ectothiorhodospiraceae bacterium WFHF3C12]
MACVRHGRLALLLVMLAVVNPTTLRAEELVSHSGRFDGTAQQVLAMQAFDAARGTLLRVRLEVSGVASGAVAHYGATGKQFTYRGRFALAETANLDPRGLVGTARAHGVDSAPPSPDSLSAVDWHVAVFGSLQKTDGLQRFTGPGPVYVLYVAERSELSIRDGDAVPAAVSVTDSTLKARATLTYYYQPAPNMDAKY